MGSGAASARHSIPMGGGGGRQRQLLISALPSLFPFVFLRTRSCPWSHAKRSTLSGEHGGLLSFSRSAWMHEEPEVPAGRAGVQGSRRQEPVCLVLQRRPKAGLQSATRPPCFQLQLSRKSTLLAWQLSRGSSGLLRGANPSNQMCIIMP